MRRADGAVHLRELQPVCGRVHLRLTAPKGRCGWYRGPTGQRKKSEIVDGLRGLCGQVVSERYRLDALLAIGGMGAVFRARHLQLDKDVAVKLLRPDLSNNRDLCVRLRREAKLSSRLDHPNCVRVFDFGRTSEGTRYLVMELLEGRDLASVLGKPLLPALAVDLAAQIFAGLDHAHRRGILHRDIKPGNIHIITNDDGRSVAKLCDFGIAKGVGDSEGNTIITQVGMIFGTPVYMSPEQAAGHEIDRRADIYATGVVLFEMLAGRPPYKNPDPLAMLNAKFRGVLPPLPDVAVPVVEVVRKLLAVKREHRYQSAADAERALREAARAAGLRQSRSPQAWAEPAPAPAPIRASRSARADSPSATSILRAFGAGLDKVLADATPVAQAQLVSGIHPVQNPADAYIDMENLQLQELGEDEEPPR